MMNKQPSLITAVVFITVLTVQWLFGGGVLFAGEGEKNIAENLPDAVTNEPKSGYEKDVFENLIGMTFVSIPQGKFIMGSPSSEPGRTIFEVQNEVSIEEPFYIQTTEVTQRQWEDVMGNNPSYFSECGEGCPVENVSWVVIQDFIKKLDQMDSSSKYRLPTEAEWEFVCRSGSSAAFSNGDLVSIECHKDNSLDEIAWYHCNSGGKTHPVGQKIPNNWGLYDMHGNVSEWCQDVYVTNYAQILYDKLEDIDLIADKVGRNCSYDDTAVSCRSAARMNFKPNARSRVIGFRLVREPLYYKIKMPPRVEKLTIFNPEKDIDTTPFETSAQLEDIEKTIWFTLQVAATKDSKSADKLLNRLKNDGYAAYKLEVDIPEKGTWYRIRIGDFKLIERAKQMQLKLAKDHIQSVVVKNLSWQ